MNVIEKIQDVVNPLASSDQWATSEHYTAFYYASLVVTNIWTYIIVFLLFIVMYWAYIYNQRRAAGY